MGRWGVGTAGIHPRPGGPHSVALNRIVGVRCGARQDSVAAASRSLRPCGDTRVAQRIDLSQGRLVRNAALVRGVERPAVTRRALMISVPVSPAVRGRVDARARRSVAAMTEDELPPTQTVQPGSIPEPHWNDRRAHKAHAWERCWRAVASVARSLRLAPGLCSLPGTAIPCMGAPRPVARPATRSEKRIAFCDWRAT